MQPFMTKKVVHPLRHCLRVSFGSAKLMLSQEPIRMERRLEICGSRNTNDE
jgi:hypothetical protein